MASLAPFVSVNVGISVNCQPGEQPAFVHHLDESLNLSQVTVPNGKKSECPVQEAFAGVRPSFDNYCFCRRVDTTSKSLPAECRTGE